MGEVKSGSRELITLENFDAPDCEKSRYILTSPMSLRACARLGIKPVELLPKCYSEFRRFFDVNISSSQTRTREVYREYEAQRKAKLEAAIRQRAQLKQVVGSLLPAAVILASPPAKHVQEADLSRSNNVKNNLIHLPYKDQRILENLKKHLVSKKEGRIFAQSTSHDKERKKEAQHQKNLRYSQKPLMQCKAALKPSAEVEQVAKEDHLRECMRRWEKQRELQSNFKKQQREERLQMKTKKRCQKENIQVLKDEESFRCWILDEQIYEMKCSAAGRRDTIAKQKAEERLRKKEEKQALFEMNKLEKGMNDSIAQQCVEGCLENKHKLAEERHQQERASQRAQIQRSVERRVQRLQQCRLTAKYIDESLQKWRDEVDMHTRCTMQRAQQVLQRSNDQRRAHIQCIHEKRRREHAIISARLEDEERTKMESWQQQREQWEDRVAALSRKKKSEIQKSRAMAAYSAKLRTELKEQIVETSFADRSMIAEMYAALEKPHQAT